jgi:hypothetical protein
MSKNGQNQLKLVNITRWYICFLHYSRHAKYVNKISDCVFTNYPCAIQSIQQLCIAGMHLTDKLQQEQNASQFHNGAHIFE